MRIEVPALTATDMIAPSASEASEAIRTRVLAARDRQRARFHELGVPDCRTNARADGEVLEEIARPDDAGLSLLREAAERMNISARGYHRVLRVARTLADLDDRDAVSRLHVAEALSYRHATPGLRVAA
jgi:magnesium chelatase family protein